MKRYRQLYEMMIGLTNDEREWVRKINDVLGSTGFYPSGHHRMFGERLCLYIGPTFYWGDGDSLTVAVCKADDYAFAITDMGDTQFRKGIEFTDPKRETAFDEWLKASGMFNRLGAYTYKLEDGAYWVEVSNDENPDRIAYAITCFIKFMLAHEVLAYVYRTIIRKEKINA